VTSGRGSAVCHMQFANESVVPITTEYATHLLVFIQHVLDVL